MTYSINNKETICYRRDGLGQGPTIRSIFLADPTFPRRLDAEAFEALRLDIEKQMKEYYEKADEEWKMRSI